MVNPIRHQILNREAVSAPTSATVRTFEIADVEMFRVEALLLRPKLDLVVVQNSVRRIRRLPRKRHVRLRQLVRYKVRWCQWSCNGFVHVHLSSAGEFRPRLKFRAVPVPIRRLRNKGSVIMKWNSQRLGIS